MSTADAYIARVLDLLPAGTPRRDQIALELRGHIAERLEGGQKEDEVLRQLGDPMRLAESYLSAVPLVPATFGRRAAAKLIDVATLLVVVVPAACVFFFTLPPDIAPLAVLGTIVLGSWAFATYLIVAEARVGQTLGKRLLHVRVVRESGARISIRQSIVRQLPLFLEVFAVDVLFALFTERSQRAFELLSKTRVVMSDRGTG
jgi:uncharacterized RDD family membrane protein YckC